MNTNAADRYPGAIDYNPSLDESDFVAPATEELTDAAQIDETDLAVEDTTIDTEDQVIKAVDWEAERRSWLPAIELHREVMVRAAVASLGASLGFGVAAAAPEVAPKTSTNTAELSTPVAAETLPAPVAADILRPEISPADITFLTEPEPLEAVSVFGESGDKRSFMEYELLESDPNFAEESSIFAEQFTDIDQKEPQAQPILVALEDADTIVADASQNNQAETKPEDPMLHLFPAEQRPASRGVLFLTVMGSFLHFWLNLNLASRRHKKQEQATRQQAALAMATPTVSPAAISAIDTVEIASQPMPKPRDFIPTARERRSEPALATIRAHRRRPIVPEISYTPAETSAIISYSSTNAAGSQPTFGVPDPSVVGPSVTQPTIPTQSLTQADDN